MDITKILTVVITAAIIAFGIYVYMKLKAEYKAFRAIFDNFTNQTIIKTVITRTSESQTLEFDDVPQFMETSKNEERKIYDINKLNENKYAFYEHYASYVSFSQMISLFPLLGLMGTVLGLVLPGNMTNVDNLVSGLQFAMFTTLAGLFASIVLKYYDSRNPGVMINKLEAQIEMTEEAIHLKTIKDRLDSIREESKELMYQS